MLLSKAAHDHLLRLIFVQHVNRNLTHDKSLCHNPGVAFLQGLGDWCSVTLASRMVTQFIPCMVVAGGAGGGAGAAGGAGGCLPGAAAPAGSCQGSHEGCCQPAPPCPALPAAWTPHQHCS